MLMEIELQSEGRDHSYDLTSEIADCLRQMDKSHGIARICAVGSTIGLTIMRYEPGAVEDLLHMLERLAPSDSEYAHYRTTGDPNGASHAKSSVIGTSVSVPVKDHKIAMSGTHRVVLFDFDLIASSRTIYIEL